jgi:serine/threonine protein phosphatase 1
MLGRTFIIGDIHGDLAALDKVLERLPGLHAGDTLVFLGDYLDRGPDSRGVIERVRALEAACPARVVALRGNHEDKWIECYRTPDINFLLPYNNGCGATFRSYVGGPVLADLEDLDPSEVDRFLDVPSWLPRDVVAWMQSLPLWFENEHGIFVHAGLEGKGKRWKHPRRSSSAYLLWMRRHDFYLYYKGKRLVFGHTAVDELPSDHLGAYAHYLDDSALEVWMRGDLIGLDTACGKGGFLSAIELPSLTIYDSRDAQVDAVPLAV